MILGFPVGALTTLQVIISLFAQAATLALFVVLGVLAARRYRPDAPLGAAAA